MAGEVLTVPRVYGFRLLFCRADTCPICTKPPPPYLYLTISPSFLSILQIHYLIEMCDSLHELHLNSNVIGDGGAAKLAHGLVLSTSLNVLNLNGNRVRDEGMGQLCMALDLNSSSMLLKQTFGSTPRQWNGTSGPSHPNKSLTSLHLASNWLRDG